jgi:hypothetical protein
MLKDFASLNSKLMAGNDGVGTKEGDGGLQLLVHRPLAMSLAAPLPLASVGVSKRQPLPLPPPPRGSIAVLLLPADLLPRGVPLDLGAGCGPG